MRISSLSLFVSLLIFLSSCSAPRMAVGPDLRNSSDEYVVKGRQGVMIRQRLSFGNYHTTKVKRSWTKGSSSTTGISWTKPGREPWISSISVDYENRKQTVNFSLTDGKNQSDVFCVSRYRLEDLNIGGNKNSILNVGLDLSGNGYNASSAFYVQVFMNDDEKPWQLLLDNNAMQRRDRRYVGYFAHPDGNVYTLHPITDMEVNGKVGKTLLGTIGLEIKDQNGRSVAAVGLIDKGTVVFGKISEEEKFLLASLCSALLLQDNIG